MYICCRLNSVQPKEKVLLQADPLGKTDTLVAEGQEECAPASAKNMEMEARHPNPERNQEPYVDEFVHFQTL